MAKKVTIRLQASSREARSWLELPEPLPGLLGVFVDDGRGAVAEVKSNVKVKPGRAIKFPHGLVTGSFERVNLYASTDTVIAEGHEKDKRRIIVADKMGIRDFIDAPPMG